MHVNASGGALYSTNGTVTLIDCGLYTNSATGGDGAYNSIRIGKTGSGGAVCNNFGSLTIVRCSFVGNYAIGGWGPTVYPSSGEGGGANGGAIFN